MDIPIVGFFGVVEERTQHIFEAWANYFMGVQDIEWESPKKANVAQ